MATMAKPNALAMPKRSTAVGPDPMPPTTAAPQPKNTSAKVPINSATCLFIPVPSRDQIPMRLYSHGPSIGKGRPRTLSIIQGPGSGHEHAHVMVLGRGMLDAACPGDVFGAPPVDYVGGTTKLLALQGLRQPLSEFPLSRR